MIRISRFAIVAALFGSAAFSFPQGSASTSLPADASASIPALEQFHGVIMQIWHEAWPARDTALLRKLQPEVEKGILEVAAAPLPGILRERQKVWEENVRRLQAAGAEYNSAAGAGDDARLLSAAEKLHGQFEALVRVTRPALKELDAFHSGLYMLYHHYLPDFDLARIRSSAVELKGKMDALNRAKLPERFRSRETNFTAARVKLSQAVDDFAAVSRTDDRKKIEESIHTMHSSYETLNQIFD